MGLKIVGKKGFGLFRGGNQKNRISKSSVAKANGMINGSGGGVVSCSEEDGVVRMKIVVKKSDLKQFIERMSVNPSSSSVPSSVSLSAEQRLNALRKKHLSRANAMKGNRRNNFWTPALQSIPEELSP